MASASAAVASAEDDEAGLDTKCVSEDGREERHVGRLPSHNASSLSSSQRQPAKEDKPYFFISHTGQDDVKEEIARPTHWFLTEILKVGAFLDDAEAQPGEDKAVAMATPAYQCTCAVVLLSPSFRKRKYCVMELNTFMYRWRLEKKKKEENQSKFRVLVALWLRPDLKGYHKDVREVIWIKHDTRTAAYYMLQTLWPKLLQVLNMPAMCERELQQHFVSYVQAQWGGPRPVPPEFCRLIKDWGLPLLTSDSTVTSSSSTSSTSSPSSSPRHTKQPADKMITGVAFSNVYTADSATWNEQVLKRKYNIEQSLEKMARHGTVTYGLERTQKKRKGFFGMGAAVVQLECEIELHDDLSEKHHLQVKKAAVALADHLREAGTSETDLEKMMIGTAWKGSIYLLLEAPESVLETLFHQLSVSENRCLTLLDFGLLLTGMTPAFVVGGELLEPLQFVVNEGVGAAEFRLWKMEETRLLYRASPLTRNKLLEGGIHYAQWQSSDEARWRVVMASGVGASDYPEHSVGIQGQDNDQNVADKPSLTLTGVDAGDFVTVEDVLEERVGAHARHSFPQDREVTAFSNPNNQNQETSNANASKMNLSVLIVACGPTTSTSAAMQGGGGGSLVCAVAVTQPVQSWTVIRRHEEFCSMGQSLPSSLHVPPCPALVSIAASDVTTLVQTRNELQAWLSAVLLCPGAQETQHVRNFLIVGANMIPSEYESVSWTQFSSIPPATVPPTMTDTGLAASIAAAAMSSSQGGHSTHSATVGAAATCAAAALAAHHHHHHNDVGATVAAPPHTTAVTYLDDMEMDDMFFSGEDDNVGLPEDDEHHNVHSIEDDEDVDYIPSASERYKPNDEALTDADEMEIMDLAGEVEMVEDIGSLAQSLGASHLGRSLQLQAEIKNLLKRNNNNEPNQGLRIGDGLSSHSTAAHQQSTAGGIGGVLARAATGSSNNNSGTSPHTNTAFAAKPAVSAPRLDSFKLIKVIGKGSFSKVYLVKENMTGTIHALKVLRKDNIIKRNQVEHTRTERSVLGYVRHPFIVGMNMAFQSKDKLYFVLDYCAGGELFFHLGKIGKFPEPRARFYAAEIVLALSYVHSLDIIYRDLKPENVLLDAEGHIRLTDFGLSKEGISSSSSGANSFCGTPEYLAPEILNRQGHGRAVDWWSLGALLYEMLTSLPPFYCQDRQRLFEKIRHCELPYPPSLSRPAKSILQGLLTKDPDERLGSGPNGDEDIQSHKFFAEIDWKKLAKGEVLPPWRPNISGSLDTSQFDKEFTTMPVFSPQSKGMHGFGTTPAENLFEGFTFTDRRLHGPGAEAGMEE